MSVQSVQATSTGIPVTRKQAEIIANLDDSQIRLLAQKGSYSKHDAKVEKTILGGLFLGLPVIDSLSRGILDESGNIGTKVLRSSKAGANWAGFLALMGLYSGAKNLLARKNDSFGNFLANHQGLSFTADLLTMLGVSILIPPICGRFIDNHETIKNKIANIETKVMDRLNSSKLQSHFLPWITKKVENFEKAAPRTLGAGKFVLRNSMWFMLGASLLYMFHSSTKHEKKVENNYIKLKNMQNQAAAYINSSQTN